MEKKSSRSKSDELPEIPQKLPLLPIRDLVVFPHSVVPLLVGRDKSLAAIQSAKENGNYLMVATQKDSEKENIKASDIFRVGTVSKILQVLEFPNGHSKVVVEGIVRAHASRFVRNSAFFQTNINVFNEADILFSEVQIKQLFYYFQEYINFTPELPDEIIEHLRQQGSPLRMIDFVALNIQSDTPQKQKILSEADPDKRLQLLLDTLQQLIGYHRVRQDIDSRVQENLLKNQRNYYLQEKLRVINRELGEEEEQSPEILKLEKDLEAANLPEHAHAKASEELQKLKKMPAFSPEYTVVRNYLDVMLQIPWTKQTEDQLDINKAGDVLDRDHYGLKKPKERILEHLAVLKRVGSMKGPILCLVGPPGVGKTSLGKSVAEALNRNFVRVSLGGVRDEAEIRGHRRTYIGSMPGKIVQSMRKAGTRNPVFLLDEIDKMTSDFRGDPGSALLEVLDPEQNKTFNDHYLDVDYDLSDVFFITTANVQSQIPLPLQDRMEVIQLPGYLEHEKVRIAEDHLIPKQRKAHGLSAKEMGLKRPALLRVIREYTREAGVRNLERELANLCRKVVKQLASDSKKKSVNIAASKIGDFLGKPKFLDRKADLTEAVGSATGLAWTAYGGDVLKIEVSMLPGKGKLSLTGTLGDVMKESAQTALSFVRSIASDLKISHKTFEKNDLHIHLPEGAVPKDGPSAGVTLAVALISALTGRRVRNDIAMTGEITLRGHVLAVGGINEKLLAAQRNGIKTVILPAENEKEVDDLPKEISDGITIVQAKEFKDVMKKVLLKA
ncbi:MAG: endopeptidase La [Calditrichia bacterium]